ncbi:hypothetical protein [Mycolicibacterium sp. 624]|uniref:hypothetical protein n=1 Tax=Mycolicibacterium sp. 624 TaxID=3156314 RepID=UPI00339B40C0
MVEVLADGWWAYRLGGATFALIFPIVGALLLRVGIHRRRAFDRWRSGDDDRLPHPQASPDGEGGFDDEFDPRLRDDYDPDYDYDYEDLAPRPSQPPGKGTVFIVVGAVVLVLGALHVLSTLAVPRPTAEVRSVDVGQCITAQAYAQGRMDAEPVDCRRSDATMELVSKGDGEATCPDGSRNSSLYPALINEVRTHCFALNLHEGYCYAIAGTFAPADCIVSVANVRVARRVDGTSEAVGCPSPARVMSYPEPARTYCFVAP